MGATIGSEKTPPTNRNFLSSLRTHVHVKVFHAHIAYGAHDDTCDPGNQAHVGVDDCWSYAQKHVDSDQHLRPGDRCTSSCWTASESSTAARCFRLDFANDPLAPEEGVQNGNRRAGQVVATFSWEPQENSSLPGRRLWPKATKTSASTCVTSPLGRKSSLGRRRLFWWS